MHSRLDQNFSAQGTRSVNVSFFQELMNSIADRGRSLLEGSSQDAKGSALTNLSRALLTGRGEASSVALAGQILTAYRKADKAQKQEFFAFLRDELGPDEESIRRAAQHYLDQPGSASLSALEEAVSSPRQAFFRRLNLAPGATACIVAMRADLLDEMSAWPDLAPVDSDLMHLLGSWFNRGFLVMRRIDWSTSASILEKIIEYEAVHEIKGWDDLRRRLDPADRRCFGFFHPSLIDEPLIFVEVALTQDIPGSIQDLLSAEPEQKGSGQNQKAKAAVFYSISNCQKGLQGISFGNFLIKQVAEDLAQEIPSLKTFVTLSPVPRFAAWLVRAMNDDPELLDPEDSQMLADPSWAAHSPSQDRLHDVLMPLAAEYFLEAQTANGKPVDPVARFHLGNGARLERINWLGDKSPKGLRQSHGIMVNYLYDLKDIESNHEAYVNDGQVAASKTVRSLLKSAGKTRKHKNKKGAELMASETAGADG